MNTFVICYEHIYKGWEMIEGKSSKASKGKLLELRKDKYLDFQTIR
jgi:hypothetical protein